jgi:hypothetical protein
VIFVGVPGPLREREFRLLFAGQATSLLGDGMVPVALAFAVLDLTGDPVDLGLVLAAWTVPLVVLLLAGGVFADRRSRRATMLGADLTRAASQGLAAMLLITGSAHVWELAVLQAAHGGATAFFAPALTGLIPATVSSTHLQKANALLGLSRSAGLLVGPAIAALLVAGTGAGWALALDATTFAVSACMLARLRVSGTSTSETSSFLLGLRTGWTEFRARRWVWTVVAAASITNLLFAGYAVLGPTLSRRLLGGPVPWALVSSALGAGMILGGLTALRLRPVHPLRVVAVLLSTAGLPALALASGAPIVVAIACAVPAGAGLSFLTAVWETTLQEQIPDAVLSRVTAYDWFGSLALQPIGYVLAGSLAAGFGLGPALLALGGSMIAVGACLLLVGDVRGLRAHQPQLRRVERPWRASPGESWQPSASGSEPASGVSNSISTAVARISP